MPTSRPTVYNRDVLYSQVWAQPVRDVAKQYGVSDVALAKACRRLGVPLPPRGHWTRVHLGHDVQPPPLPPLPPGQRAEVVVERPAEEDVPADVAAQLDAVKARQRPAIVMDVTVPTSINACDASTRSSYQTMHGTKLDAAGYIQPQTEPHLDVRVSPKQLRRAHLLLDALAKAVHRQYGGKLIVEALKEPTRGPAVTRHFRTVLTFEGERFGVVLHEKRSLPPGVVRPSRTAPGVEQVEWWLRHGRLRPTGQLQLRLESERFFNVSVAIKDGKRPLEAQLGALLVKLDRARDKVEQESIVAADRRTLWEAAEQQRLAAEKTRQAAENERLAEEARRQELLRRLERWRLARDTRAFVADMRSQGTEGHGDTFLVWAEHYAEQVEQALRAGI